LIILRAMPWDAWDLSWKILMILPATVAVLGVGSWGTALALLLARNGHTVRLWGHDPEEVAPLRRERENRRYLPGIPFPAALTAGADLAEAVAGVNWYWRRCPAMLTGPRWNGCDFFCPPRRVWPGPPRVWSRAAAGSCTR
jgi:hypothetical protein